LVGIDISQKMLTMAAKKSLYDELYCDDLCSALRSLDVVFDVIIAADVFVYLGELNSIFEDCVEKLTTKGLLAFTIEVTEAADYCLSKTSRYSHHLSYIDRLATKYRLSTLFNESVTLRKQDDVAVKGRLFILQQG